ncbi:MAG: heptaprenyl diphosphate synthase [Firmicutes bacterium]|nr:heptaprenyl diphosphate synthase [Bacillota bacterium]
MSTKKIALLSVLMALGIVLNGLENLFLPWSILPAPGARVGLANIVFLIILLLANFKTTLTLSLLRIIILNALTGTLATPVFPLSLGGAVLSLSLMKLSRLALGEKLSLIGLSIIGAIGHNLGQLLVLMVLPGLFPGISALYLLLPGLLLMAIPAGMITGWVVKLIYPTIAREWRNI